MRLLLILLTLHFSAFAQRPALLPEPADVQWREERFALRDCRAIVCADPTFRAEAVRLQASLKTIIRRDIPIAASSGSRTRVIELSKTGDSTTEAYTLDVRQHKIRITAGSAHGVFNAIQTLLQLTEGASVQGADIRDQPAFAWRAYMVDVGRNYQPMALLKQQIDVMSRYKLNVFHFHFTEDVAWRLHFDRYPQLTDAANMTRQKGKYYTKQDLHELIRYCRDRHIELVPEIDMPGHSAAFRRAMGVDMQSDSGFVIVQQIVRDFCREYDVRYLHIGADEVKITNHDFVPQMTKLAESLGKTVIGWMPGGNLPESAIHQLWSEGKIDHGNTNVRYIDSRQLYINHMDALESVVSIYQRRICNTLSGSATALGATLCLWHDRNVAREEDVMVMNPVYPALLAFAERCWKGGGSPGFKVAIGAAIAPTFAAFEQRLMAHKQRYFKDLPFTYFPQNHLRWNLYGPFHNGGDLLRDFDTTGVAPSKTAIGGTIILRHWWAPSLQGVLDTPRENTTWYASTRIWSDEDADTDCWIGFSDYSRSYASRPPAAGTWDNRQSLIRVNGDLISPPVWSNAGGTVTLETPLIDEGYAWRNPTRIRLKKGWNTIEVKAPVAGFKGADWQNPVKWMFTFIPCGDE
ncbi:family 20 glycosylhydrolase [Chitinophaga lutea]